MQKLVALLLIAVLAGSVTIPNVFSDDEKNTNGDNDNDNHQDQNGTKTNDDPDNDRDHDKVHFGFSNATSFTVTLPNGTSLTFGFSNGTNPGQQISAFIHKIRDAFKQQETQAKQLIKDCREKARDATNHADKKAIMDQCKIQLKQINQQFKGEHKQLQLDFKQFRETVIGKNQENHEDSHGLKGNATGNHPPFAPNGPGLKKLESHNGTKIQHPPPFPPKPHGPEQKLESHGNQNGKQKHGKDD